MKRRDEGKASLVEFMRSIKFHRQARRPGKVSGHFAELHPQARQPRAANAEDHSLVRSAN